MPVGSNLPMPIPAKSTIRNHVARIYGKIDVYKARFRPHERLVAYPQDAAQPQWVRASA